MIYLCIYSPVCSVWFCLVYSLLPVYPVSQPCLVLPCLVLMSSLKTIILSLILVCVFLYPPCCVHRDSTKATEKNCIQVWNNGETWRKRSRTPQRRGRRSRERRRRKRRGRRRRRRRRRRRGTTTWKKRGRARRQTVSYILVDGCQGWIRHARGFYPRCLARTSIACDVEEALWPVPDQRRDAGAE